MPGSIVDFWDGKVSFPSFGNINCPDGIKHTFIHRSDDRYKFLHESAIISHGGSFFAAWNASAENESERGTVVRWIRSDDCCGTWTEPKAVAPPLDPDGTDIWESIQFLSDADGLYCFIGQVHFQPRISSETGGRTVIFRYVPDSDSWNRIGLIDGFHPLNRPQRMPGGGWIMGGQYDLIFPRVAVCSGGDLSKWEVFEIPSSPDDRINFAETSLIADAHSVTAFIRCCHGVMLSSESFDGGRTWAPARKTNIRAVSSKSGAGMLSTGQRCLLLNIPSGVAPKAETRDMLVMLLSRPGERLFSKAVAIRQGEPPVARIKGYAKNQQWSYPAFEEFNGSIYVTYSVTKEDCCLSVFPVASVI